MPRIARPIEERFWEKVDKTSSPDGCWLWTGCVSTNTGYGQINQGGKHGTHISAHKLSWQMVNGPKPAHLYICHRCDNHRCVNPDHLFAATQKENMEDMVRKGRKPRGVAHPHTRHTNEEIRGVFDLYAAGVVQTEIARRYGVRQTTISNILRHKTWGHLSVGPTQ